jgi:hypothetical protein
LFELSRNIALFNSILQHGRRFSSFSYVNEEVDFQYKINGTTFDHLFILVDGIYPEIARFVQAVSVPVTEEDRRFTIWQEKSRKDVERGFGLLKRKFKVLRDPLEMWFLEDVAKMVRALIVLHNMMVEERVSNNQLESIDDYDVDYSDDEESGQENSTRVDRTSFQENTLHQYWKALYDRPANQRLRVAIKHHLQSMN